MAELSLSASSFAESSALPLLLAAESAETFSSLEKYAQVISFTKEMIQHKEVPCAECAESFPCCRTDAGIMLLSVDALS